jgi:hypothetical protein
MGVDAVGARAATRPEPGFHVVTVKKAGFSVELPDTWVAIDLTKKQAAALLKGVRKKLPELAAQLPDDIAAFFQQNVKFFAVDPAPGERHGNVNAVLSPDALVLPPKKANKKYYKEAGLFGVHIVDAKIGGRPGYELNGMNQRQFWVIGNRGLLIFAFSSSTADDPRDDPVVMTMMESVKLLR